MHQYGEPGLCLMYSVNNALQKPLITKEVLFRELREMNDRNTRRNSRYYAGKDGIDFRSFKTVLKDNYRVYLRKVKNYKMKGRYIVTYDFKDVYHTVALVDGELLDSEKKDEMKDVNNNIKVVDVYKVIR